MNRQQYLLSKLSEEAAEVAQMAMKCQQFGFDDQYPNHSPDNFHRLKNEINDLMAIVKMLSEECNLKFRPAPSAIKQKIIRVNHFGEYAKDRGMIHE